MSQRKESDHKLDTRKTGVCQVKCVKKIKIGD